MKTLLLSLIVSITPAAAAAEIIVIPVQDMLFVCPDWDDAPDFDLNAGLGGGRFIGDKKPIKFSKEKEKELLALLQEFFPDSKLKIWNGNLIVK